MMAPLIRLNEGQGDAFGDAWYALTGTENATLALADLFKKGETADPDMMNRPQRIELLDSLCDQIVTAVATAYMLGMDLHGALSEVCRSNESKFGEDGEPIFDQNRKIIKGPNYSKPKLDSFV